MDKETREKIIQTINSVMDLDVSGLDKSAKLNTIPKWDSFNNLMLISKFQDDFDVEFSASEIEDAQTMDSILALIDKKISK